MEKLERRLLLAIAVIDLATLICLLPTVGLLASTLEAEQSALSKGSLPASTLARSRRQG